MCSPAAGRALVAGARRRGRSSGMSEFAATRRGFKRTDRRASETSDISEAVERRALRLREPAACFHEFLLAKVLHRRLSQIGSREHQREITPPLVADDRYALDRVGMT